MKMRSKTGLLFFLLQLCCGLLFFGQGSSQVPLDLQEALRLAKQNNLKLKQQQAGEQVARLQELVQKAQRLPSLDFSATSSYVSEINEIDLSKTIGIQNRRVALGGHDRSELMLGLQQPIFTGFRLESQVDLAKNASMSEELKFDILANEIYHQVYLVFYQAQDLYNSQRILETSLKRLQIQLQQVRNLFDAAQVMAFDTLQVYNQALSVKIELADNRLATKLTNLQMARLLDLPRVRPIAEVHLARPAGVVTPLQDLEAQALSMRPELKSVRLAQQAALIQQKLVRSSYFPNIFASANFHYAKPGLDPVANSWMDYYSVGVKLQWNLWRWKGDQKKVQTFQVHYNRLTLEERELLRTVEYEVEESFEKLQFSLQELELAEELQAQQEERYRIVSVQHRNGIASTNDLVTAETDLTRAALQTHRATIKYYIFLANLKKAVGTIAQLQQ
ncbi:MAG: TolC family protein [bacterium]